MEIEYSPGSNAQLQRALFGAGNRAWRLTRLFALNLQLSQRNRKLIQL
jgi:hypothetical protein